MIRTRIPVRHEWPTRPTRLEMIRPRGLRERIGAAVARPLIERYDFELSAETSRSDEGWSALVMLRDAWNKHMRGCPDRSLDPTLRQIQEWADAPSNTASA